MKNKGIFLGLLVVGLSLYSCKDQPENTVEITLPEAQEEKTELPSPDSVKADGKFQLVALPYAYDALEPHIDAKTVEIHYSKHHLGYANNLNKAVAGTDLESKTLEEVLTGLDMENKAVRNNAGGLYNHNLYWEILSATKTQPSGALLEKINADFGSVDALIAQLSEAGAKQFGSGWAWLVVNKEGKLQVGSTPNQDNPLMPNVGISGTPIIGIDVWEHAYYLNYQNQRPKYIEAFFNILNWDAVAKKYDEAINKQ
jgi:Fe-Mn family superoxide dismutase